MKVLYMSHRYHTNQSAIMKGWLDNGHEVRFISQYAGKIEDYTCIKPIVLGYCALFRAFDYIYIHFLKRKDPSAIDMKLKLGFPPIFKLAKHIKKFNPDLAILRERSVYTICMNAVCKLYGIPTILYDQSPIWHKPVKMDWAHKLVWKLTPEYRITPTQMVGIDKTGLIEDKKAYWAPFVMEPRTAPENKTYFADDRINIFCIGKYQERKNLLMMIEAVEELLPKYDIHLTIAGEVSNSFHEEYYAKLANYAKEHELEERLTLLVNISRAAVAAEYQKADVYVLPSTGEPAAVSPLEAMSFSLPAICGSDNGTANYIEQGKTGYVFEDNNKEDLKSKLEEIISDRQKLVRMGAAGYRRVQEKFRFRNYYEQIEAIMKRQKQLE